MLHFLSWFVFTAGVDPHVVWGIALHQRYHGDATGVGDCDFRSKYDAALFLRDAKL
jgi:hypothetical protein